MNSDQTKGKWKQFKGSVKEKWGKLTDDDIDVINGQSEQLVGKIQEKYGIAREAAQRQVDEWNATLPRDPQSGSCGSSARAEGQLGQFERKN